MNSQAPWPTRAILGWLECILAERFGHAFSLENTGNG